MKHSPTLVLFTKAPRFGTVKTRLAARIGPIEALRFHRTQISRLARLLGRDRRWRLVLAVTPNGVQGPWACGYPRQSQGRGDLGRRMMHGLNAQTAGPVVLIGSDIPAITPAHIARAFKLLTSADVVYGPAEDGGFWLVGISGRRPVGNLFPDIRWSTPATLSQCLAAASHCRIGLTDTLADRD